MARKPKLFTKAYLEKLQDAQKHVDIITLIMNLKACAFDEAIEYLSAHLGLEPEYFEIKKEK